MSQARVNILKRIETALRTPVKTPFPEHGSESFSFSPSLEDLQTLFVQEFTSLDGHVIACRDNVELSQQIHALAKAKSWKNIRCITPSLLVDRQLHKLAGINNQNEVEFDVGLTDCECLVARTGTVVMSAAQDSGRILPVYSPVHLIVTTIAQFVFDIEDALQFLENKYPNALPSAMYFAAGPSRTADIEKRLVLGVHGPKEVYLFLMTE
jgi:L-lactate dehydrogenase complex protein LldG